MMRPMGTKYIVGVVTFTGVITYLRCIRCEND